MKFARKLSGLVIIVLGLIFMGGWIQSRVAAPPLMAPTTPTPTVVCTPCACADQATPATGAGSVGQAAATSQPAAHATIPPVAPTPLSSGDLGAQATPLPVPFLIGGGILVLVLAAVLVYFLILQPRKKRALLIQAQKLIAKGTSDDLQEAETLLNKALVAGMAAGDVAEARFALGFVRAQLEHYPEAAAVVAELRRLGKVDRETLYLDMWLQFKLEKYDAVERIYEDHQVELQDLQAVCRRNAKMMAGIAFLRLARQRWLRNEVKEALDYYQKVRSLDVESLKTRIPENIDDQQIVLGIRSLFDKRIEEARNRFEAALRAATDAKRSTVQGELGLLLCDWREGNDGVDDKLGNLLQKLQAETQPVASRAKDNESEEKDVELSADQRLLRNARFWHAALLIVGWQRLPPKSGLPEAEHSKLDSRLEAVRAVDMKMPDVELVGGLIAYYFPKDNAVREAAISQLIEYRENGGNLADVLALLEREEKSAELYRQSLERYLGIVRGYLEDPTVREDLRQELLTRLSPFERFKQIGEIDLRKGEIEAAPSIDDLQNRSKLLRMRVEKVIKPKLEEVDPQAGNAVTERVRQVDELAKALTENSSNLQKAEYSLLATAGELLLQEETPVALVAATAQASSKPAGSGTRSAKRKTRG
jgi:hypothetical protein